MKANGCTLPRQERSQRRGGRAERGVAREAYRARAMHGGVTGPEELAHSVTTFDRPSGREELGCKSCRQKPHRDDLASAPGQRTLRGRTSGGSARCCRSAPRHAYCTRAGMLDRKTDSYGRCSPADAEVQKAFNIGARSLLELE